MIGIGIGWISAGRGLRGWVRRMELVSLSEDSAQLRVSRDLVISSDDGGVTLAIPANYLISEDADGVTVEA